MYDNYIDFINKIVNQKISARLENSSSFACQVLDEKDGLFIDVEIIGDNNEALKSVKSIQNVMVMQSVNYSPCIKKGDIGFLWDIRVDLSGFVNETLYNDDFECAFYIFIPLLKKSEFVSNAKDFYLQTNEQKTKLTANDESLTFDSEGTITTNIKGDITHNFEGNSTTTAKGDLKVSGKSISVEATGSDPLKIKNTAGGLKEAFDEVFSAMDALKASALVAGQATLTWLPQYDTAKQKAQQLISKIVG